MIQLKRTNSNNSDFILLVEKLDKNLAVSDGDDHDFYHQFNGIDSIKYAIVAYKNQFPIACGAIKQISEDSVEIKRMYTLPEARGNGIATELLTELETWAAQLGYNCCILETGKKQPKAIALYYKTGYKIIPNYAQYAGVENSLCFEKHI